MIVDSLCTEQRHIDCYCFTDWFSRLVIVGLIFFSAMDLSPDCLTHAGLLRTHQYSAFQRQESPNASTWRGFWKKLGRLLPYMWPSNSPLLQLRVVFCLLLLIGLWSL
jgi:hypothetical protein